VPKLKEQKPIDVIPERKELLIKKKIKPPLNIKNYQSNTLSVQKKRRSFVGVPQLEQNNVLNVS
jgi:hypothetical protein